MTILEAMKTHNYIVKQRRGGRVLIAGDSYVSAQGTTFHVFDETFDEMFHTGFDEHEAVDALLEQGKYARENATRT